MEGTRPIRLTLVTSVLNGMPFLPEALDSVEAGPGTAVELLVIDAGSTDGTLDFLRTRPGLRLMVKEGLPLYDAWNLAVREARGEVIGFLNADDLLGPGACAAVVAAFDRDPALDVLCGRAKVFRGPVANSRTVAIYADERIIGLDLDSLVFGAPIINAKFFRRSLFGRIAAFDPGYAVAADRAFLLKLLLHGGVRWALTDHLLYQYRAHPGSKTLSRSAESRMTIAVDHLRLAESLLADPDCPQAARKALQALRARETLAAGATALRSRQWSRALSFVSRFAAGDAFVPARVARARRGVRRFAEALAKGGG